MLHSGHRQPADKEEHDYGPARFASFSAWCSMFRTVKNGTGKSWLSHISKIHTAEGCLCRTLNHNTPHSLEVAAVNLNLTSLVIIDVVPVVYWSIITKKVDSNVNRNAQWRKQEKILACFDLNFSVYQVMQDGCIILVSIEFLHTFSGFVWNFCYRQIFI